MRIAVIAALLVLGMSVAREDVQQGGAGWIHANAADALRQSPARSIRVVSTSGRDASRERHERAVASSSAFASRPDSAFQAPTASALDYGRMERRLASAASDSERRPRTVVGAFRGVSPSSGRADGNERRGPGWPKAAAGRSHVPPACPFRESPEHHYVGPWHRKLGNGWMRGCSTGYASWETGSGNETFCGPELQNSGRHTSIAKRFRVSVAPCGSILRVCTLSGSKCIRVTVVDQGPCYDPGAGCWDNLGRDLDLNYRASVWFKGEGPQWENPVLLRWKVLRKGVNPPWG